jgi:Pectate lyase superfamily protein
MQNYQNNIANALGVPVVGATVKVLNWPSLTVATIYSDNGITVQTNPMTSGALGFYSFYAKDGNYAIQVSGLGLVTQTFNDIMLYDDLPSDQPTAIAVNGGDTISIFQGGVSKTALISQLPSSGGVGTVTSVGMTVPSILSVAGSPITSAGTFTVSLANENANLVFAGPSSGGAATPTFRALVPLDYPTFVASGASHASGAVPDPGASANTTHFLREDATWAVPAGTGTVTSVGLVMPGIFTTTGTPVTSSGSFNVSLNNENANTFLSGPTTGGASGPTFRTIVPADMPVMVASGASHASGAVPDPGVTAGTTHFLREDGTWQVPAGSGTVTSVALTTPSWLTVTGSPVTSSGTLAITANTETANTALMGPTTGSAAAPTFRALVPLDYPVFVGSGASHAIGAVPDPGATAGTTHYLREDGTWVVPPGSATTLAGLTDVNVVEGAGINGYSLTWSNGSSKWVATNVSGGGGTYTGPGTGAVARTVVSKLGDIVSVKDFGAVGDGATDDTTAIQNALNYCTSINTLAPFSLYFPAGNYKITAALVLCSGNTATITGWRITGAGRFATTITQFTNNTPIFSCAPNLMHSTLFEHMQLNFNTLQTTANTLGNTFNVTGTGANDWYNSAWFDIGASNQNIFMNSPSVLWWGNSYEFCWFGNCATGVNYITGGTGEPRCTFTNLYITPGTGVGPLFTHSALYAEYHNIEVNGANGGATMLYDGAGGSHIVGNWLLEVATYAANATLWNIPNGVFKAENIYTNALTINSGVTVNAFNTSGTASKFEVRKYLCLFSSNAGNFYLSGAGGPLTNSFGYLNGITFNANCQLTNVTASTCADFVRVDEWNDPARFQFNGDANVTLNYDSPMTQILDIAITANRTWTLPDGRQNGSNNLFSGRKFNLIRSTSSSFAVAINDIAGTTLATFNAGSRYNIELMWHRDNGAASEAWCITRITVY